MTISRTDESGKLLIGTGPLPGCKKPCLWVGNEYVIRKVGTFQNEDAKKLFEAYWKKFLNMGDGNESDA